MDKHTNDILPPNADLAIETYTYSQKVTMNISHFHSHYEILYVFEGERKLIINNLNEYSLNENTIAVISPNCIHRTKPGNSDIQTRICLAISEKFMQQLIDFSGKNIIHCTLFTVIKLDNETKHKIKEYFATILTNKYSHFYSDYQRLMTANLILTLSHYTYDKYDAELSYTPSNTSMIKQMAEIAKYIQQHAYENISLESVSKVFNIRKSYLARCFKAHTGTTIVSYINNVRIIKAQQFLIRGDAPISTIAYMVGYNNRNYFERVFKKIIGISPKQYQLKEKNKK